MHWSAPEESGGAHSFCSICGSRAQSRRQMHLDAASLKQQIELLREIARRQAEELEGKRRAATLAATVTTCAGGLVSSGETGLAAEHNEVVRLRQEIECLRANVGDAGHLQSSRGLRLVASPQEREAECAAERCRWEAERAQLEAALADVRRVASHPEAALPEPRQWALPSSNSGLLPPRSWESPVATHSSVVVTGRLQEELAAERRVAAAARERIGLLCEEGGALRAQEQQNAARQHANEEAVQLQRRVEGEAELRRSQRTQFEAASRDVDMLRSQLVDARRGNAELRGALERQQELLLRLQA